MRTTIAILSLALLLAFHSVTAVAADLTPDALLQRGLESYRAARYQDAVNDLSAASQALLSPEQMQSYVNTGKFENLAQFETSLIYLALAQSKLGHDDAAREAVLRLITAERIEPAYAQLPLAADAAEFETLAPRLVPGAALTPNVQLARGGVTPASAPTAVAAAAPAPAAPPTAIETPPPAATTAAATPAPAETTPSPAPAPAPEPVTVAEATPAPAPPQTSSIPTPAPTAAPAPDTTNATETAQNAPKLVVEPTLATERVERQRIIDGLVAQERAKIQKAADEQIAAARAAAEQQAQQQVAEAQRTADERVASERAAVQKTAEDRVNAERAAAQKAADDRIAAERAAAQQQAQQQIADAQRAAEARIAAAQKEAQDRIAALQAQNRRSYLASLRQADAFAANDQVDQAARVYSSVATSSDVPREVLAEAAVGLYRTSSFRDAVNAFQRLAPFARGEEDLRYYNAVSLYETGRYADANKELACALPFIQHSDDVTRYQTKIEQTAAQQAMK